MRWCWLLALAACGDNLPGSNGLAAVSGASPYALGCGGPVGNAAVFYGFEVEPMLAADPADPMHLVGAWQQDRWTSGGANGIGAAASFDGGATWTVTSPAFTTCSGGTYARASDPWVAITSDGTPYVLAIAFDGSSARSAIVVASSPDGGLTWNAPIELIADDDPDVFNDKDSISADAGHVYATWDRLTGLSMPQKPLGTGPAMLARLDLPALTWEPARPIFDPGVDAQTLGNVIAVLPDGTLVDVADVLTMASTNTPPTSIVALRSTDHGDTWSAPVTVAQVQFGNIAKGHVIRDGEGMPQLAVDHASGALYVAWEGIVESGLVGIRLSRSDDGGLTWSAPVTVNGAPAAQAFTPSLAVAADGTLAVQYDDTRDDDPKADAYAISAWLAVSHDHGATFTDEPIARRLDLRPALVGTGDYFLGDYQGLAARNRDFVPFLALPASPSNPTDIFTLP